MIDNNLILSHEQAETTIAPHVSTNLINTGAAASSIGWGEPLFLNFGIHTLVTSAGAATLVVALDDCATVGGTYYSIVQSFAFAVATLKKGFLWTVGLPSYHLQFLQGNYTIGAFVLTAGKWNCWLGREQYKKLA